MPLILHQFIHFTLPALAQQIEEVVMLVSTRENRGNPLNMQHKEEGEEEEEEAVFNRGVNTKGGGGGLTRENRRGI